MPDPTWPSSPPEANYLRLAGPGTAGSATTMACSAAWQALAVTNEVATSASALNTAATAPDFEGVGGMRSATVAGGLNAALQLLAGWAQEKPPIAASAVAAYETAVSSMIPAAVSLANRAEQAADVALNPLVLGALTPAIVALDTVYFGEHWPQNAAAGAAYGIALGALVVALAVPPPLAPPGASPTAGAAAAAAVAQGAGQVVAGEAAQQSGQVAKLAGDSTAASGQAGSLGSAVMQPVQAAIGAAGPMTGMFQAPMQAVQGLFGLAQPVMGALARPDLDDVAGRSPGLITAGGRAAVGGIGSGGIGTSSAGGATGVAAPGAGAGPGAGLTSFTRPNNGFAAENGGRPTGLKPGLLSVADLRGPAAPVGPAMMPTSAGMPANGKEQQNTVEAPRARIAVTADGSPNEPR